MQTTTAHDSINRGLHTSHYLILPNAIAQDNTLGFKAYRLLTYLLSLPKDWKVIPRQLSSCFKMGRDAVYNALKELRERGYAILIRGQRKSTWRIYDTPQSVNSDSEPHVEVVDESKPDKACKNPDFKDPSPGDALQSKDIYTNTKKQQPAAQQPIIEPEQVVVIKEIINKEPAAPASTRVETLEVAQDAPPNAEIPLPNGLKPEQHAAAKKLLQALNAEQITLVLRVFNIAQAEQRIKNAIAYLHQLVKATQDGTLTQPENKQALPSLAERIAAEEQRRSKEAERHKITNTEHQQWLVERFGYRAEDYPPSEAVLRIMALCERATAKKIAI